MINNYFSKNRSKILPWVTDWTSEHEEVRNKPIHKMNHEEWFWFTTINFKIVYYSPPILFAAATGIGAKWALSTGLITVGVFLLMITGLMSYQLYKKIKSRHQISQMTMYDFYLRDILVGVKA